MKTCMRFFLTSALLLSGCSNRQPRETVFVLDVSQSIDADAEHQMFVVVEDAAKQLRRGDTLTIIPITGNAEAELQGRTLHYSVPPAEDRQAYDADLLKLNAQIKGDLERLHVVAVAHPGKHSDILGSIRAAMMEFSDKPTEKRMTVLSDFIQDDKQFNFRQDSRLATIADAVTLGKRIVLLGGGQPRVGVILGRLRSREYSELTPSRQKAINAFWEQTISSGTVFPDGTSAIHRNLSTK